MKKVFSPVILVIVGVFFLSAVNTWAQTSDGAPSFDKSPSVVLDLWKYGGKGEYSDNIKFNNATLYQNVSFNIYGYDEKKREWTLIGASKLKEYSDTDQVKTSARIKNYRWFAVHSLENKSFNAQAIVKDDDILLYIIDSRITALEVKLPPKDKTAVPSFDVKSSVVIDLWQNKGKGKYEDKVLMLNKTKKIDASFNVFAYDEENGRWIIIGTKKFEKVSSSFDEIDSSLDDEEIEDFRWLAVYSLDDLSFDTQVVIKSDDIRITVVDK